jgi:hypothetical protein
MYLNFISNISLFVIFIAFFLVSLPFRSSIGVRHLDMYLHILFPFFNF